MRWITSTDFDRSEKVAAVTRIYDQLGIRSLCEERINGYFSRANECLSAVGVAEGRKEQLRAYAREMMHRKL